MSTMTVEVNETSPPHVAFRNPIVSERRTRVSAFVARSARMTVAQPVRIDFDDEMIRAYVSRLWSEDWDSPEDTVYDKW